MPKHPLIATSEGWRGPLKEVKSEKAAPVSVRNETLCRPLCQLAKAPSPSVWGGLGVWSLALSLE